MRRLNLLDDFAQDAAYAARVLRKSPVFALAAAVTIALGIGAATAIFSVTNAVLLRPLPYRNADRLVVANTFLSNADYFDLRSGTTSVFDDMAAVMVFRTVVPREDGSAERINKGAISTNFLRMMGARIALGRDFTDADGQPHGAVPPPFPWPPGNVAILSYDYFQRRYHGDPGVLGRELPATSGRGPRIVGVLAPGFKLYLPAVLASMPDPEVWIANDRGYDAPNRGGLMLQVIATLKPGMTPEHAAPLVNRIANAWGPERLDIRLKPWRQTLVAEARPALLALMGAVTFLLLIACANVANLLLVRASHRERELAVRAALGARAGRLTRQLLAEALLLCGLGTLLGIALASFGVRELLALAPGNLPRLESTSIDWRVLAFAALAGALEAAVFGALPGWRATRPDIAQVLRGGGRAAGLAHTRFLRNGVVVAEVALSFVLLAGSGLLFRSFLELRRVDPGFDPHRLLTFLAVSQVADLPSHSQQARVAFLRDFEDRLRAIPGVESVGAALGLPLSGNDPVRGIQWSTAALPADPSRTADIPTVLPGYFETLRSRMVEGRTFNEADNAARDDVAVIDQSLAAQAFPGQSALGKRVCIYMPDRSCLEVIGVIAHQHLGSLAAPGRAQIYIPDGPWGIGISRHWALRTAGDPARYAAAARAAIARFAPGRIAITEMRTMDAIVERAQSTTRFHLLLIGIFAAIAALLAAVGLYGVLASVVRQRTSEIGVRMALGAAPVEIFKLVVGQGLALAAAGIALGLAGALALTRSIASMLVDVRPGDPLTLAAIAAFFFVLAAAASWPPAWRAARLDPTTALRE
jgi:putative ABC transport system permease protein